MRSDFVDVSFVNPNNGMDSVWLEQANDSSFMYSSSTEHQFLQCMSFFFIEKSTNLEFLRFKTVISGGNDVKFT